MQTPTVTPAHCQHWKDSEGREWRIMTVTQPGYAPPDVLAAGFRMSVGRWGGAWGLTTLLREVTETGQKPRPWANPDPQKCALTWILGMKEPWVVFYRYQALSFWAAPLAEFVQTFTPVVSPAPAE